MFLEKNYQTSKNYYLITGVEIKEIFTCPMTSVGGLSKSTCPMTSVGGLSKSTCPMTSVGGLSKSLLVLGQV